MDFQIEKVVLRRARLEDVIHIVRLLYADELGSQREILESPLPAVYINAFQAIERDSNNELMVADLDSSVIGTFQMTFITYLTYQGSKVAQIEAVRVNEKFRSKGIGEVMIRWAIEEARRRGCQRVQLTTHKLRQDAHRFYQRLGFTPSHEGMKLFLTHSVGDLRC